jgi:hypothetical protein
MSFERPDDELQEAKKRKDIQSFLKVKNFKVKEGSARLVLYSRL